MASPTDSSKDQLIPLYHHAQRQEWGLAILAWERGPRRAYQFEDGKLRVFRKGYYEMLEEVDTPADRAMRVIRELERKLGNVQAERARREGRAVSQPELSFIDQIRIFRMQHPDGFQDKGWLKNRRGVDRPRRLKRHRDPAIAEAREKLSEARLDEAIAAERFSDVHAAAVQIVEGTNLVSSKQIEPLTKLPEARHRTFATALREVLYGDGPFGLRFERYVATLALRNSRGPSWQLATVLPALVQPDQHVCIRPATFRKQAAWMAPRLAYAKTPNGPLYERFADMARAVEAKLEEDGLEPADLMDVYDFMVETLKPAAKKLLEH